MKRSVMSVFKKFNIDTVGITDASLYNAVTGSCFKSVIVALFPYYRGYYENSNISIYTHGIDYHTVIKNVLTKACEELNITEYAIHSDIGPEIERTLAVNAGLCFIGRNGMCINDIYGSYFFIGYVACNKEFEIDKPCEKTCLNCMKCVKACPGGALADGFLESKCLSAITQKKGELSAWEKNLIKENGTVFGCDICQKVCPHNENAKKTTLEAFTADVVERLEIAEISGLSNREFLKKYKNRSFAWRGKAVLERNLKIIHEKQ